LSLSTSRLDILPPAYSAPLKLSWTKTIPCAVCNIGVQENEPENCTKNVRCVSIHGYVLLFVCWFVIDVCVQCSWQKGWKNTACDVIWFFSRFSRLRSRIPWSSDYPCKHGEDTFLTE
jgi:hypothetical protein